MKNYETPIIEVVLLEYNDVILTSTTSDTNFGNWSWDEEEGI